MIKNLFIEREGEDNIGLFGVASGDSIENIGLDNLIVRGGDNVGGFSRL